MLPDIYEYPKCPWWQLICRLLANIERVNPRAKPHQLLQASQTTPARSGIWTRQASKPNFKCQYSFVLGPPLSTAPDPWNVWNLMKSNASSGVTFWNSIAIFEMPHQNHNEVGGRDGNPETFVLYHLHPELSMKFQTLPRRIQNYTSPTIVNDIYNLLMFSIGRYQLVLLYCSLDLFEFW